MEGSCEIVKSLFPLDENTQDSHLAFLFASGAISNDILIPPSSFLRVLPLLASSLALARALSTLFQGEGYLH